MPSNFIFVFPYEGQLDLFETEPSEPSFSSVDLSQGSYEAGLPLP
jgi:hypothetical protein